MILPHTACRNKGFSIWDLATSSQGISPAAALPRIKGAFPPRTTRSAEGRPVSLTTWHRRRQAWLEGKGGDWKFWSLLRKPRGFSSFFLLNETVTVLYKSGGRYLPFMKSRLVRKDVKELVTHRPWWFLAQSPTLASLWTNFQTNPQIWLMGCFYQVWHPLSAEVITYLMSGAHVLFHWHSTYCISKIPKRLEHPKIENNPKHPNNLEICPLQKTGHP